MAVKFKDTININGQYTLPEQDGTVDQVMSTDGAGVISFVDLPDGEAVKIACKNTTASTITKGTPVYVTGTVGSSFTVQIAPADASNSTKMPAVGLLETDLAANGEGFVITGGLLKNLTTDPIDGTNTTSNDTIYVKAGGGLTMTKPTGTDLIQNIGKIGRVNTSNAGSIVVSSILRTNDVPNLTEGKIWVGSANNTEESTVVHIDETNIRIGINQNTPDVTLDITGTDAIQIPKGTDAERPTPESGMIRFNTTAGEFEGYNGTEWAPIGGANTASIDIDNFTGDGTTVAFTLASEIQEEDNTQVYIDGVYQSKSNYSTSGTTLTFTTAPPAGTSIEVVNFTGIAESQLDGTGTTNYIAKWTDADTLANSVIVDNGTTVTIGNDTVVNGDLTVDTNTLYVDSTNNRVGIGTASPAYQLQVQNSASANLALTAGTADNQYAQILFGDSAGQAQGRIRYENFTDSMQFVVDSSLAMTIGSSSNVGIGTTNNNYRLNLSNSNTLTAVYQQFTNGTTGTTATDGTVMGIDSDGDFLINNQEAKEIKLYTSDTLRLAIDSTGNIAMDTNSLYVDAVNNRVGINTVSPSVELEISSGAPQIRLTDIDGGYCEVANVSGHLLLQADKGNTQSGSYMRFDVDGTERMKIASTGDISFRDTSANEAFYWDASTARLGIGTDSPNEKLHLNGGTANVVANFESTDANVYISFKDDTTSNFTSVFLGAEGNNMAFYAGNASSPRMTIDSSGRVGIGTASPQELVDISKDDIVLGGSRIRLTNSHNGSDWGINTILGGIDFYSSDNSNAGTVAEIEIIQDVINATQPRDCAIAFKTRKGNVSSDAEEKMRIDSRGRVGINETNPQTYLQIKTDTTSGSDDFARFDRETYGEVLKISRDAGFANIKASQALTVESDYNNVYTSGNSFIRFKVDGSEKARILNSGGLTFNGDTAAANALDDYEEGTFSAALYENGGSTIFTDTDATYVKIGSIVHIEVQFGGSAVGGGSGELRMNLPFAQAKNGSGGVGHYSVSGGNITQHWTIDGLDYLQFTDTIGSIAGSTKIIGSDWNNGSRYYFSYTYSTI